MSLSNILQSTTQNEHWSKIYVREANMTTGNILNLNAGGGGTKYLFPTAIGTATQVLQVNPSVANQLQFTDQINGCLSFGGAASVNPRFLKLNGEAAAALPGAADYQTNGRCPVDAKIGYITYTSQNGNNTTGWRITINGVANNITFPSNSFVPASPLLVGAGQDINISWQGVGTQPDGTTIQLWFSRR